MMKWRVQGKAACSARKSGAGIRSAKRGTTGQDSEDVRASLDFLDQVIAEYNSSAAESGLAPLPEHEPVPANAPEGRVDGVVTSDDGDGSAAPAEAPFSINLVIVNGAATEKPQGSVADDEPPPVPKRSPPSLPRSSSTSSVTSSRDYPVSPPPRRRYLSPERRRRALMMNTASACRPHTPDLLDPVFRLPAVEPTAAAQDSRSLLQLAQKQRVEKPDTTLTCQSDAASRTLLRTGCRTYSDDDRSSRSPLDRVDSNANGDVFGRHTVSADVAETGPFVSPPVQIGMPKEFADLSSPTEVSRALIMTGSHTFDRQESSTSSQEKTLLGGFPSKDNSLPRRMPSPICSRTSLYSSPMPRVFQREGASTASTDDEEKLSQGKATMEHSPISLLGHFNERTDMETGGQKDKDTGTLLQNGIVCGAHDSNAVSIDNKIFNGLRSQDETSRDRDRTRLTVTFRTLPETETFRRKSESRNSIHVDFNVRDGAGRNEKAQSAAADSSEAAENTHGAVSTPGLCRSLSLRSNRKPGPSSIHSPPSSRTTDDFSPPPLPPRKAKDEARRQAEENASPTPKRVTFHILPATHESTEAKGSSPTVADKPCEQNPGDGFFTRPKAKPPAAGKTRAASPMCHRAANGSHSPAGKIREPSPLCQRRANESAKTPAAPKAKNGVQSRTGSKDNGALQVPPAKEATTVPIKKTFEPPSAASEVSTDCYNVYNVRTGKISSSVTKPNALGRSAARAPLESVQGTNGTTGVHRRECQLTKLRNISPTREAEKLIGKIISRCKSSSVLNGKEKKASSPPTNVPADATNGQPPQVLKLTARQQQRHSRCTKCALAQAK